MTEIPDLGVVQTRRKTSLAVAAIFGFLLLVTTGSLWDHPMHRSFEAVGTYLIALCIFGRVLCSIYISGQKGAEIIAIGPYSVCRNPLYVFSFLGAVGVGILSGSIIVSIAFGLVTWIVFRGVVVQEEVFLLSKHGLLYRDYLNRVPRFVPDFSLWDSGERIVVNSNGVIRTFTDASLFLLAIPLIELLEFLKETGRLPLLVALP